MHIAPYSPLKSREEGQDCLRCLKCIIKATIWNWNKKDNILYIIYIETKEGKCYMLLIEVAHYGDGDLKTLPLGVGVLISYQ